MIDSTQVIDSKKKEAQQEPGSGLVRTGFLLLGSAVFGGIAVALWNRRTLAKMQNRSEEAPKKILPMEDDAIY
jgi:hypothetical protein